MSFVLMCSVMIVLHVLTVIYIELNQKSIKKVSYKTEEALAIPKNRFWLRACQEWF